MASRLLLTLLAFLVAVCPPFVIYVRAETPPTLSASSNANYEDNSQTDTTGSVSWTSGDLVLVVGVTEDNASTLGTPTTTGTGLNFALETATNTGSTTKVYLWSATASATSSGTVSSIRGGTANSNAHGITVTVWTGHGGLGTETAVANDSTNIVWSYTRSAANVAVLQVIGDWNAISDTTTTPTPSTNANQILGDDQARLSCCYAAYVSSWGDQGAAGASDYGLTDYVGGALFNEITVEILGVSAGGAAVVRCTLVGVCP